MIFIENIQQKRVEILDCVSLRTVGARLKYQSNPVQNGLNSEWLCDVIVGAIHITFKQVFI